MIETALIYIKRNKIKSLIIILIIATIILGEIIGLLLNNASEKSERDAYLYNGAALVIEDDNGGFTKSDYDEIRKVKYVTGLGAWRELIADPVDTENVKEHKGIDPENKDVRNRADKMVIVANMDVQQYSLFSWEKNVGLKSIPMLCFFANSTHFAKCFGSKASRSANSPDPKIA